mgnify:FL=1|jgi:8-oxo-dGTP pyrophosphatase MutT (NUDIX family)
MTNLQRWHPHVTVATVIKRSNQYLMVEERSEQLGLVINQPAGHVDPGEGIVDAAIRETLEETCWSISIDHLVGIYQWSLPQKQKQNLPTKTYLRFTFAGQIIEDHSGQVKLDADIVDTHWLTLSEIENKFIVRSPLVVKSILDYETGRKIPLNTYQNLDLAVN